MFSLFHKKRQSNYAPWVFVGILVFFMLLSPSRPAIGLAGGGAILMLGSILIEINRKQIWDNYKQNYKPSKSQLDRLWSEPKDIYYKLNVLFVWPLVFVTGLLSITVAYLLD